MSASEIALFSLSRFQLRALKERFRSSHRKIKKLLGDPGGLLITILVINEIVNISLSTVITSLISKQTFPIPVRISFLPDWAIESLLGIMITAPIVLILCEITPKVIAARANQLISTLTAGPLTLIYDVFKPVRMALTQIVTVVSRWTRWGRGTQGAGKDPAILREADFMMMVEEGHKEGAIQQSELELIRKVFEFDDTTVDDLYTPFTQVQTLSEHTPVRTALAAMKDQRFSRIPVVSSNQKEVVGILYSKDLLKAKVETDLLDTFISEIMRRPLFVAPTLRLNTLFRKFKDQKTHMAVVQMRDRHALGIITMSDILDNLFEDFMVEDEQEENHP